MTKVVHPTIVVAFAPKLARPHGTPFAYPLTADHFEGSGRMGSGGDALLRQPFSPAAPEYQATPRLELVDPHPVRRTRPVAILKIPRLWPGAQFGRVSTVGRAGKLATAVQA